MDDVWPTAAPGVIPVGGRLLVPKRPIASRLQRTSKEIVR